MPDKVTATTTDASKKVRANEKKWTKPLMDAGWTAFPSIILEKQQALGLQPLDINIILHLAKYWWEADNKPHPSKSTIAAALGIHPRTVQKRIAALEAAGFIKREYRSDPVKGNKTNIYDLDGLIKEVTPWAVEKNDARKESERNEKKRIGTKRRLKPTQATARR